MVSNVNIFEASMPLVSDITSPSLQCEGNDAEELPDVQKNCSTYSDNVNSDADKQTDCTVPTSDAENDPGYVSYDSRDDSSDNSYQMQLSQNSVSQSDTKMIQNKADDWLEVIAEDQISVESVDSVDDLLYHFDQFFRNKFDSELSHFKKAMCEMLSEQQIHMRQIVHSVEMSSREEHDVVCPDSGSSGQKNLDRFILRGSMCKEKSKACILLELTALSCGVSALLNENKYRL